MTIRAATADDVPEITAIYNFEVLNSTATFDSEPVSIAAQHEWLARHRAPRHPVLVAEADGAVVGWASLSPWSGRCAYARAAEVSVYVHADHRGEGVGKRLLQALLERGRSAGLGVALARICSEGQASIGLHRSLGFAENGTMRRVGEKFGRVLDVVLMDCHLDGQTTGES